MTHIRVTWFANVIEWQSIVEHVHCTLILALDAPLASQYAIQIFGVMVHLSIHLFESEASAASL